MNYLHVVIGGGIGAGLRFLMQELLGKSDGHSFPLSTFLVNITGCFLIGLLAALAFKMKWPEALTLLVFTGLLGGFTTFSSFSLEFFQLMKNNHNGVAFMYLGLSNIVGLGLCWLGYLIIK